MKQATFRCACCKRILPRDPRVKNQRYWGAKACQRARKSKWQREKLELDSDHRWVSATCSMNASFSVFGIMKHVVGNLNRWGHFDGYGIRSPVRLCTLQPRLPVANSAKARENVASDGRSPYSMNPQILLRLAADCKARRKSLVVGKRYSAFATNERARDCRSCSLRPGY